ncbi:MAG: DUF3108 domain-containing protein [Candidatus Omnitrophica bacterium]|nr:DUF3108 domain-containing protein [Candidatus Omnitrophota bacterium]
MRRDILFIILILLLSINTAVYGAQNFAPANKKAGAESAEADIIIEPPAARFAEYEKLTYRVKWLGLPVGIITASIKGIEKIRGRDAYHLEVLVKTNDFCSAIYKIDDRFTSYMDAEGLYTLRHEVHRREGGYKKDAVTDFDQVNHKAYFENFLDKSKKEFTIPPNTQDTLTASYYFRTLPIQVGKRIEYAVCNNESNYKLFGLIEGKGIVRIPKLGRQKSFYIQPYAKLKGQKVKKGRVSGYFSCDERRLPLLAVVRAPMLTKVAAYLSDIEYRQKPE